MIKQILNSPDSGVSLYGMTFGIVTVVGIVREIDHSSTKITFKLEDHTGQIDAHLWLEEGDTASIPPMVLNTYARVNGSVRNQGGTKTIMIFKIEPLESINGLTTHLLEFLMTRYKAEDYASNGGKATAYSPSRSSNQPQNSNDDNVNHSGLKGKQLMVFEAIRSHKSEQGISMQELQRKFSHISASELQ